MLKRDIDSKVSGVVKEIEETLSNEHIEGTIRATTIGSQNLVWLFVMWLNMIFAPSRHSMPLIAGTLCLA